MPVVLRHNGWQGGVAFKDIPLWRNVRKGTIIVVNHRDHASNINDKNKYDGYIEVSASDRSVFDTVNYSTGADYSWNAFALSISVAADILEVLDNNDNHVHSLSHNSFTNGDLYRYYRSENK